MDGLTIAITAHNVNMSRGTKRPNLAQHIILSGKLIMFQHLLRLLRSALRVC